MEEDAGKSMHDRFAGLTAIDLNRAGTPLIEIVEEPDIRSAAEAGAYLRLLKQMLEYIDVSDVNMEEGTLRVDANISRSVARGATQLGTKTEVKNMNSFSGVERAHRRRVRAAGRAVLEAPVARSCRRRMLWDADRNDVRPARSKEGSHDYRYFPDPDLPPLLLTKAWIARIQRDTLPELPDARVGASSCEYRLTGLTSMCSPRTRELRSTSRPWRARIGDAKTAANWVLGDVLAALKSAGGTDRRLPCAPADVGELLIWLEADGAVSNSAARTDLRVDGRRRCRPEQIAEREGLAQGQR